MTRDEFAKQFIQGAIDRGASREAIKPALEKALTDFDSQNASSRSLPQKALGMAGDLGKLLFSRTAKTFSPQNIMQTGLKASPFSYTGKSPQEQAQGFASGVVDPALGVAGEIAPWLIPGAAFGKGPLAMAKFGATTGAIHGATTPDASLGERTLSTVGEGAIGGMVGGGLGLAAKGIRTTAKAGKNLLLSQFNVPRSAARTYKLEETVTKLSDYGINDINEYPKVAEKVTGNIGVLTKLTREAAAKSGPVDTKELSKIAKNLIENEPNIAPGKDKRLFDYLNKGVRSLTDTGGKTPAPGGNPMNTFKLIQEVEGQAASLSKGKPSFMISSEDKATAKILRGFADELKDRLYQTSGGDDALKKLIQTPEIQKQLNTLPGKLAEQINKVKTVSELRSLAAPFVRGDSLYDMTQSGKAYGFQNIGGQAKGLGHLIPTLTNPLRPLETLLSSGPINAMAGGALGKLDTVAPGVENMLNPILLKLLSGQLGR